MTTAAHRKMPSETWTLPTRQVMNESVKVPSRTSCMARPRSRVRGRPGGRGGAAVGGGASTAGSPVASGGREVRNELSPSVSPSVTLAPLTVPAATTTGWGDGDMYAAAPMDPQLEEPDLRSYLGVIARRRWLVILTTVLCVGVAVAVSIIPEPQYRVRAQVSTTGAADHVAMIFGASGSVDLERQAVNQLTYVGSSEVRAAVARAYDGALPDSDVWRVGVAEVKRGDPNKTSSIVELSLVSTDPAAAATLVNTYARTYVSLRAAKDQEALLTTKERLNSLLRETEQRIEEIMAPVHEIDAQIAEGTGDPATLLAQREATMEGLAPELQPLQAQASEIRNLLGDLNLGIELAPGGGAEVLSPAWAPDTPVNRNIPLNLAIGLVFGLFLGAVLAFVRDYFDDSVKTKEMAERVTGVATLGLIPKIEGQDDLVTATHPTAPAAEAFRMLRTSVKFLGVERQVRVVQVTSPSPGEGKTMVAVNLAVAFAQAGDRVVIVGGDLRRPRMEEVLEVPLTPGLTPCSSAT